MTRRSVAARLEKLEKQAGTGKEGLVVVNGIGKPQEEIDQQGEKVRAEGHKGMIIILDR